VPKIRAVTALCAAVSVVLSACGSAATPGPDRAREAVGAFLAACQRQEASAVIGLLSPAERTAFVDAGSTLDGCARVAGISAGDETATRRAMLAAGLQSILVKGDEGTATLRAPGAPAGHVDLDEHGLTWQVHSAPEGA